MNIKYQIATYYVEAWNKLNIHIIKPYLHEEFEYGSQMVLEDIKGKQNYLKYLGKKFLSIHLGNDPVFAELAEYRNEPCVLLIQQLQAPEYSAASHYEDNERVHEIVIERYGIIVLKFQDDLLKSAHMCMISPNINDIVRIKNRSN